MSVVPQVTRELVSAPLPQIIQGLGVAIAEAQRALDENSVRTAALMAETPVTVGSDNYNLLALGFTPAFYSFSEATVEAKLSFSMTETTELGVTAGANLSVGAGVVMVGASVSVSYARKFSVSAEGQSSIAARLVSLPPPEQFDAVLRKLAQRLPPPA